MGTPVRCLVLALACTLGCAPIEVNSTVSVRPRPGPSAPQRFGAEQIEHRDFVADYLQLGSRLLVELREHPSCVSVRHVPVMRVETIERSSNNFVVWDFVLGTAAGGLAAFAFTRPQTFSPPLLDGQGLVTYNRTGAYVVGGVFAAIAAGLLAAGVVNALRSTDTTRYADAFELELGPAQPCTGAEAGAPVAERSLRLVLGDRLELEGRSDARGRVRFELPPWDGPLPPGGRLPAVLELEHEPRVLALTLRLPYESSQTHSGVADTRHLAAPIKATSFDLGPVELPAELPIEGPAPAREQPQP